VSTTPTSGPSDPNANPPPPEPPGPWASDNLPAHPMAGYRPAEVEQPPPIRTAVRLMLVGAALSLLGLLLVPFETDTLRDAIEDSDGSLTASEVDTAVDVTVATIVVISLIGAGLWVWMAVKNGQGRSWARVVATILGGLNILSVLSGLVQGNTTPLSLALSLVTLALAAVILWLLYRPEASRFYDARSR
jgi:hypothetical protein